MTMKPIKILFVLALFTVTIQGHAQTIVYTGHVTDNERNDLMAATVRYYEGDTVFVKGCATNSKGEFKLEVPQTDRARRLVFSYLGYKDLTMNIQPTKETNIQLGDIVMNADAVKIHEVFVLGSNRVRTEDKLMVYPTKDELRHAYDGYSALDVLSVPGLNVNTFNNTINYMHQSVLLCIDGREATQDEVRDLNAKYIKRVDVYTMGRPDFPQAGTVIDFVMRDRDYAGTASFTLNHHLTRPEGDGRVSSQYYHNKSEFALSLAGDYNNYEWRDDGHITTIYNFPGETVTRTLRMLPSDNDAYKLNGYLNYIYRDKVDDFYASLRLNHSDSETDDWGNIAYSISPTLLTMQENAQTGELNPGLKLQYTRTLPHDQRLRMELYGSYGDNDYDRWYELREDETVDYAYRNSTSEKSYYGSANVNYTKTFRNRSSLNLSLSQNFTHTDDANLRGDASYDVSLNKSNTRLNATYNHRIKNRLNLQARFAGHLSYTETGGNKVTNLFLTPSLRLSYMYKGHSINLQGEAKSREASNSNRTGDEYRNNEFEITQGNPELKDYMNYTASVFHVWDINKHFTWMAYASIDLNTNYTYKKCSYDADRNSIIWKVQNSGVNWLQHYEAAIDWNIIPKRLRLRAGLLYNYTKVNLWETIYHHGLYGTGAVTYQYKGFRAMASVTTSPEVINSQTGQIVHTPTKLNMNVSYSINNWNFKLSYNNPYRAEASADMDLGIYRQDIVSHRKWLDDNYGTISVSYRFTYGKKHKFDNTEVKDVNQTTISKQEKVIH